MTQTSIACEQPIADPLTPFDVVLPPKKTGEKTLSSSPCGVGSARSDLSATTPLRKKENEKQKSVV
jgi:hypothetical protein